MNFIKGLFVAGTGLMTIYTGFTVATHTVGDVSGMLTAFVMFLVGCLLCSVGAGIATAKRR